MQAQCRRQLAKAAGQALEMETECAALVVRTRASLVAFIPQSEMQQHLPSTMQTQHRKGIMEHYLLQTTLHLVLPPAQAANRHDAAELAAKQAELAALQTEAARLSSSNTAQAEHEARFRTAAERCADPAGFRVVGLLPLA